MTEPSDGATIEQLTTMLIALEAHDLDEAYESAAEILDVTSPATALLQLGNVALLLRRNPSIGLQRLIAMIEEGDDEAATVTHGEIGIEFLDILDQTADGIEYTAEGREILSRFDRRPGSAQMVEGLARAVSVILGEIRLQLAIPEEVRRSPDAIFEFSKASTRSVLRGDGPLSPFARPDGETTETSES